jgi:cytochrome c oxidase assembly protein subunit 15
MTALRPARVGRRLSPVAFRRIALGAAWALGFIIVTGGAVRLTGSGLGCPDWPTCTAHSVVAPWQYHKMVEFGNRVVTAAVSVAVIAAVLGSHVRAPRRRDLVWLSWGLVAGLLAQIVLGGEAVKHDLAPQYVMAHFLLSMLLLWDAVVLHHRAGLPDGPVDERGRAGVARPAIPLASGEQVLMTRLLCVAAALVIVLGTVVTSSGPHGGDPKARRFAFSVHDVARLHSSAVWLFLALTAVTLWSLHRSGSPASVMRRGELLLVVIVAQGAIGYVQYFTGVPAALVVVHIAMAALLWAVTVRFALGMFRWPVPAGAVSVDGASHQPSDSVLTSGWNG